MALNVLFLLGTMLLVRLIARELWPRRERLALGAVAFVAFVPVTVKTAAMFHPETLSLFLSTLALWLCVRTFADRAGLRARRRARRGAARARVGLWTVAAVVIALLAGRRWRELAIVLVLAGAIPAPWYIHQRATTAAADFNRADRVEAALGAAAGRLLPRPRHAGRVTKPYRPHFLNLAMPTTYTEIWGDYFGVWSWRARGRPADARGDLQLQSVLGLLPTLLAVVGWLLLLLASLRSPPRLAIALLPLLGILGYLYFTVSLPDRRTATCSRGRTCSRRSSAGRSASPTRSNGCAATGTRCHVALLGLCAIVQLPFLFYADARPAPAESMSSRKASRPGRGSQPRSSTIRLGSARDRQRVGRADERGIDDDRGLAESANAARHSSGSSPSSCHASSKPASANARSTSSQTWWSRPCRARSRGRSAPRRARRGSTPGGGSRSSRRRSPARSPSRAAPSGSRAPAAPLAARPQREEVVDDLAREELACRGGATRG